jgi:hypothetical protein
MFAAITIAATRGKNSVMIATEAMAAASRLPSEGATKSIFMETDHADRTFPIHR